MIHRLITLFVFGDCLVLYDLLTIIIDLLIIDDRVWRQEWGNHLRLNILLGILGLVLHLGVFVDRIGLRVVHRRQ